MVPERYSLANLLVALQKPGAVLSEIRRQAVYFDEACTPLFEHEDGLDVLEEDWDNLILLDACRFDTFQDANNKPGGDLSAVRSKGSNSPQFLHRNFEGERALDTVYVSGNGWISTLDSNPFHAIKPLYENDWDDTAKNVRAKSVTKASIRAHEEYPNKRLIIHYMQPHAPFFGEFGQQLEDRVRDGKYIWSEYKSGLLDATTDEMCRAYKENLELVLGEVNELLDEIDGKTVVSSDHGELFGERLRPIPVRGYEHPSVPHEKLREVPWLEIEGERREVTAGERENARIEGEDIEEKLESLGYM